LKKLLFVSLLIFISGCALLQRKGENLQWPSDVNSLKGEGDLDVAWRKEHFSGPFVVSMAYPDQFILEVYGPFGQTLIYVRKEAGRFLLVAGDEKTNDEAVFEQRYGFRLSRFMNDLAMRGDKQETTQGWTMEHEDYRVDYGQDRRGRRKICWESRDGSICLTFDTIKFTGP
jgi:hypothetical protein